MGDPGSQDADAHPASTRALQGSLLLPPDSQLSHSCPLGSEPDQELDLGRDPSQLSEAVGNL